MRVPLATVLTLILTAAAAAAQPVVFLVRHAERADSGTSGAGMMKDDPDLSAAGRSRAASLAGMLKDAGITAIVTTEYRRTKQTAEPLATALGIQLTVISAKDSAGLAARLAAQSGNVLVVGHSNTLPDVIAALGLREKVEIPEEAFDNLFIVVRGSPPTLLRLHYR